MGKYRTINVDLNRQYRNDLNWNFAQIEQDILSIDTETVRTELLAELERVERESKERDNALAKQNLETLLQSIEDAKANANNAASNATTQANYAETQGNYAKTQGDYAKNQGDYASSKGDYADEKAILADEAAANANTEASNLSQLKTDVVTATQNANTQASHAQTQGDYAKTQGDYAKAQGELVEDLLLDGAIPMSEKGVPGGVAELNAEGKVVDANGNEVEGKVTSVNGQIGDVQIETFSGDYNDLINKPDLSTKADKSEVTNLQQDFTAHQADFVQLRINFIDLAIELETMKAADLTGVDANIFIETFQNLDDIVLERGEYDALNKRLEV